MQRIEDVVGLPEIGRRYLVPCVKYEGRWWPVIGPVHDDREIIGFPTRHYHHDARFTSATGLGSQLRRSGARGTDEAPLLTHVIFADKVEAGPAHRSMVCQRQMPDFPLCVERLVGKPAYSPFKEKLEAAYAGKRMDPKCMKCPHRGFPLSGLPVRDGVVVCPGHGLAWNVETGELVKREATR